jgi:hypothetical protein
MLPSFYHDLLEKYRHPNTITYSSNVGIVVTDSKRSQKRTISGHPAITDLTK